VPGDLVVQAIDKELPASLEGDDWVPLSAVLGTGRVPAAVAAVLKQAVDGFVKNGDVTPAGRFRALELLAADWLAGPQAARAKD
jgi:hypothetical protein